MVDFSLSDEERQIGDTVRSFIEKEVTPLEVVDRVIQIHGGMGYPPRVAGTPLKYVYVLLTFEAALRSGR